MSQGCATDAGNFTNCFASQYPSACEGTTGVGGAPCHWFGPKSKRDGVCLSTTRTGQNTTANKHCLKQKEDNCPYQDGCVWY
jgi:hypothetical protein